MALKGGRSTDHNQNLISSESGQNISACKISGHSLFAFSGKYPGGRPVGRTDGCTGGKRVFLASDGRMDGQSENIMPPAPEGGGIITMTESAALYGTFTPAHLIPSNDY